METSMQKFTVLGRTIPTALALLSGATLIAASSSVHAQADYPNKPIRLVVAFSAGGPNDVMARILAAKLSANMGQQFIVDNRAGAGGTIGSDIVAKANPDGYTLLFPSAPFVTAPALYGAKLPYDTLRDLTGISKVAESPLVLTTTSSSPYKTLPDLLKAAKAKPQTLNYGSGGIASTPHLATSLLEIQTGAKFQHIPFKGGGPSIQGLMGNQVDFLLDSITTSGQYIASGRLVALAQSGARRSAKLPNVPTFAEAGVPTFEMTHWVGISAPSKTPPAILDRLQQEVAKALASDEVKARLAELGASPAPTSRAQFNEFLGAEVARWTKIVKQADIKPE
jgi:tripartite-type tricarboxylate transporter receptor subunit TctC